MPYRINFNGKAKAEAKKAFEEESAALVKARDMRDEQRTNMLSMIDQFPEGNVSGYVHDFNNGTVVMSVTVKDDMYGEALGAPVVNPGENATRGGEADPRKGMPGAADKGRPDASPSAQAVNRP